MSKNDKPKILVPSLRFPEFAEAGPFTLTPLSKLASPVTERVRDSNVVPYTITGGVGLVSQEEKLGRTIAGKSISNYYRLKVGDFAFNKSSTKSHPEGYIARLHDDVDAAVPSSIFTCFRCVSDEVDGEFLDWLFQSNLHGNWLRKFITVGARAHGALNVNDNDLFALPVPLPPGRTSGAEQRKIAECLCSLDDWIAAETEALVALRRHKTGLMQQLFPRPGKTRPNLRFPAFQDTGEWTQAKLDELAKRGSGHTPSKSRTDYYNGGLKWISLADSRRLDNGLISETAIEISEEGIKNSSAVLHPAGSVVLSRDAGVGRSAVISDAMAVSQHFIVWTCDPSTLSHWFLYHQLQRLKPIFEQIATGSTIKTIGLPFFKELRIAVPTVAEQERVAACLSSLDGRISAQGDKLAALRRHKRGLMQQLFPVAEDYAGGGA